MTAGALPEYRIKARNTSTQSENAIHHDDVARSYGFAGGLVPGVTVYAYVTHPLVAAWGPDWLERGTASVRFTKPLFEGDEALVAGPTDAGVEGGTATVSVRTGSGAECSTATATLPHEPVSAPDPAGYVAAPLPAERPPAVASNLCVGRVMGSPVNRYDADAAAAWLDKVEDHLALYRGPPAYVHPAFYLDQANKALSQNVRLGPWIHVSSVVQHLSAARVGETLATRGRVRTLFEKKGREFVELDLLISASGRPVAHVLHTAIYRLPPPK
jgi:acyl-coenzyme A thioesterase PaaI-like protein